MVSQSDVRKCSSSKCQSGFIRKGVKMYFLFNPHNWPGVIPGDLSLSLPLSLSLSTAWLFFIRQYDERSKRVVVVLVVSLADATSFSHFFLTF